MNSQFKDKCDNCHTWQFDCHGYKGQVLCPSCTQKIKDNQNNKKIIKKQLNILDFDKKLSQNSHTINDIM